MQLNEAVSKRLVELMQERGMTQYQLYMKSGVPKSTIVGITAFFLRLELFILRLQGGDAEELAADLRRL